MTTNHKTDINKSQDKIYTSMFFWIIYNWKQSPSILTAPELTIYKAIGTTNKSKPQTRPLPNNYIMKLNSSQRFISKGDNHITTLGSTDTETCIISLYS